jgi:uncharacterized membrane protein YfcA
MPPLAIIPVHAVVQVGSNFFRATMMWRNILFRWMPTFVIGTLIGAAVGGQIVFALPKYLLQGIIGIFVLYAVWGPKMKAMEPSRIRFAVVGAVASFATMFAGATGPLIAPFIKASTTDRMMTVATHAAFMSWQHGVKILAFGFLGFRVRAIRSAYGADDPVWGYRHVVGKIHPELDGGECLPARF